MKNQIAVTIEGDYTREELEGIEEIFNSLVRVGGLTGVRGGNTIIHFNAKGNFVGIGLDYKAFWKRNHD